MIRRGDFIEIDYTARIKDTLQIFDTTEKSELQKIGKQGLARPIIIIVGEGQVNVETAAAGSLQQRLLHQEDILHQLAFAEFVQETLLQSNLRIYWDTDATVRPASGQIFSK